MFSMNQRNETIPLPSRTNHVWNTPVSGTESEAHLGAAQVGQILLGGAALEIDFEVHGGEVWGGAALEEGLLLFRKIGAIFRAVWRGTNVDDAGVLGAGVLVGYGMADVGVPEDGVAGQDFRDGDEAGD